MRVVLDTSVLVAAHISRAGVCAELLEEVLTGHELVLSEFILSELQQKLYEKFGYSTAIVRALVLHLRRAAELVPPEEVPLEVCRDPDDLAILGTATAGQADLLVTVDKDLVSIGNYKGIAIIKPGEFWHRTRA